MITTRIEIERAALEKLATMPFDEVMAFIEGGAPARPIAHGAAARTLRNNKGQRGDPAVVLTAIQDLLRKHPDGLRLEGLREGTGFANTSLSRALSIGLEAKSLKKKGDRRATTYYLTGVDTPAPESKPVSKAFAEGRVKKRSK
jgi:hypothetical protein